MNMIIIWAILFIVFIVLEAVTAQLVSIWFVVGSGAALISALCDKGIYVQLIVFISVSVIALLITRPLVKKYIHPKAQSTNADRCIGKEVIVVKPFKCNEVGQVKIDGKIWSAVSDTEDEFNDGETVLVDRIEGVKLIIKKSI